MWRHRYFALAALAVLTLLMARAEFRQWRPPTVRVLVAAQALSAGTTLAPSDLRETTIPRSISPQNVLTTTSEATGHVLVHAVPAGMPIARTSLLSDDFLAAVPDGTAIVALRLDGATATLLEPGRMVALYPASDTSDGSSTPLADEALIMGVGEESVSAGIASEGTYQEFFVSVPIGSVGDVLAANVKGIHVALLQPP